MSFSKYIINMAGAARSIDASMMPSALGENIYNDDIHSINNTIMLILYTYTKMDISISSIFTAFSNSFLYYLQETPLSSVEKVTNRSILMFTLQKTSNSTLTEFFSRPSIQMQKIKSNQKSMLFLIREMARNDITSAQLISGSSINELIELANKSNAEISKIIAENNFIYAYRGDEQALIQTFKMPESVNAKMQNYYTIMKSTTL